MTEVRTTGSTITPGLVFDNPEAYISRDRRRALAEGSELPDRVRGAALFADISGFTPLTEALAAELGPQRGAEELTASLNRVFHAVDRRARPLRRRRHLLQRRRDHLLARRRRRRRAPRRARSRCRTTMARVGEIVTPAGTTSGSR